MTDPDERISRRYRELAREEPPSALDAAIIGSAHRAVRRPRSRSVGALSIAAVLVLAFGVTLRMQHEEPGVETSMPQPQPHAPATVSPPPPEAQAPREAPRPAAPKPRVEKRAATRAKQEAPRQEPAPAAADVAPAAGANALSTPMRAAAPAATQKLAAPPAARAASSDIDMELERIAALREQGKDDQADEALARFRERHPGYTIPDAIWARVKPR